MNGRHVSIIMRKEFRGLFNERTILLAVLLQLFIAMFSSFLMVGLTSMYDPSSLSKYSRFKYSIAYIGNDSALQEYLAASPDFTLYKMELSPAVALAEGAQACGRHLGAGYAPGASNRSRSRFIRSRMTCRARS
jgi:hypothetical protein